MADWRLRGIPPALWRRVRDKAGDQLRRVLIGLMAAYADGLIDPLAEGDPVATALGARGGTATAANRSAKERHAAARDAARARWDRAAK